MTLRQLTSPTTAVVSLPDLKKQCRCEYHTDDDAYLVDLELAAVAWAERWLGSAVAGREWEFLADDFSAGLVLPITPVISVDTVVYDNAAGVETALAGFRSFNEGTSDRAYILPPVDTVWPEVSGEPQAVRVVFTAGLATVPAQFRHAIRLLVAGWYENRESVAEKAPQSIPFGVEALLLPLRNWA
jgi:uncharacterized phiE125 gp8 family phage protein